MFFRCDAQNIPGPSVANLKTMKQQDGAYLIFCVECKVVPIVHSVAKKIDRKGQTVEFSFRTACAVTRSDVSLDMFFTAVNMEEIAAANL